MDETLANAEMIERAEPRVLIVQPNRHYLAVLARRIAQAGYRVATADGAQSAFAESRSRKPIAAG